MKLSILSKRFAKFVGDNSPAILTGMAVVGTLTTAYLTGIASFKAAKVLERNYNVKTAMDLDGNPPNWSKKDLVKQVWQLYVPACSTAVLTCICVVGANRIGARRTTALAAAYSISERAFAEYKDKVIKTIGKTKEESVRAEIAKDRMEKNPPNKEIVIQGGKVLCLDMFSGRYFESSMEEIKKAQNDNNYEIIHNSYCSLNDFYDRIGLPSIDIGEEVGWNSDHLMEVMFATALSPDGQPCLSMSFHVEPRKGYNKFA